jgi:hypothetical protein
VYNKKNENVILYNSFLQASALRGITATSGHGVFSVRQGLQKDARPNGFKRLPEFTKGWVSLRFVLTGSLCNNAGFNVSQNKKAFFRPCLTEKTSEEQ